MRKPSAISTRRNKVKKESEKNFLFSSNAMKRIQKINIKIIKVYEYVYIKSSFIEETARRLIENNNITNETRIEKSLFRLKKARIENFTVLIFIGIRTPYYEIFPY